MARDKYNNQLKGGDGNSNYNGYSNGDSNDNDADANNSTLMTTTKMTCPGCASCWWWWWQCLHGGGGERDGNGRGGGNGGSRRGGQWAGWTAAVQRIFFSPIIFLTITATATEGQDNGAVSSREAHPRRVVLIAILMRRRQLWCHRGYRCCHPCLYHRRRCF